MQVKISGNKKFIIQMRIARLLLVKDMLLINLLDASSLTLQNWLKKVKKLKRVKKV